MAKPRRQVGKEKAPIIALLPTPEEFEADCQALTAAFEKNWDLLEQPNMKRPGLEGTRALGAAKALALRAIVGPLQIFASRHFQDSDRDVAAVLKVPHLLLEFLLKLLLRNVHFEEQQYLACNHDVAKAVEQGKYQCARQHFVEVGYFEGRVGGVRVDEAWYLAKYPDVTAAKKAGKVESGETHYRLAGASEWRIPNPEIAEAVEAWRAALVRESQATHHG